MITIFAPAGIGEVSPGSALAPMIEAAVAADPAGPLRDGDIVVVTSKIISKAEGRSAPAQQRTAAIDQETAATVAVRGETVIVRTHGGLTVAAAGVDTSNVEPDRIVLLPPDPDQSAARLRAELEAATGCRLGVIISDTAGRAWRLGQTDHAIGSSGVRVLERYAGRRDRYGNELSITAIAIADELAAAADLAKAKLAERPVAVLRGLSQHLCDDSRDARAADLLRPHGEDLFPYGSREAVIAAVLAAVGRPERFEEVVRLAGDALLTALLAGCGPAEREVLERVLAGAGVGAPTERTAAISGKAAPAG